MKTHRTPSRREPAQRHPACRAGFTLLELLVTISVIVVLVGIISTVGFATFSGQKASQTRGVLSSLDRSLEEYLLATGSFPKYRAADYVATPGSAWTTTSNGAAGSEQEGDGFNTNTNAPSFARDLQSNTLHPRKPSAGVFLNQARGVVESEAILASLPQGVLLTTPRATFLSTPRDPNAVTVLDGWALPENEWATAKQTDGTPAYPALKQSYIVYVHPSNLTAQALYGECKNGRPYFMSAGPDRLVGLRDETDRQRPSQSVPAVPAEEDGEYRTRIHSALDDNLYSYPVGPADRSETVFQRLRLAQ